jgi:hypothetical protein
MWSQLEIPSRRAGIDVENRTPVLSSFVGDVADAVSAFLEKRAPRYTGSDPAGGVSAQPYTGVGGMGLPSRTASTTADASTARYSSP